MTKSIIFISVGSLALLFLGYQYLYGSTFSDIETLLFKKVKTYEGFEIRKYEKAIFARYDCKADTYGSSSNQGFKTLANYIFGGNEQNMKIDMTAPVVMEMDESIKMEFKLPRKFNLDELPKPNNPNITLYVKDPGTYAVIEFSGYANQNKIDKKIKQLKALLNENKVEYYGSFEFRGYDSPFNFINRRNEVAVKVKVID